MFNLTSSFHMNLLDRLVGELQEKEKVKTSLSNDIEKMRKGLEDLKPLLLSVQKAVDTVAPSFNNLFS
jgi:hypothetical protein